MGYYSTFEVDGTDIPFIKDVLDDACAPYTWSEYDGGGVSLYAKWYDWLTDLDKVASLFPDKYLIILRYGEEGGDITRAVVNNGHVEEQYPELVWPPVE